MTAVSFYPFFDNQVHDLRYQALLISLALSMITTEMSSLFHKGLSTEFKRTSRDPALFWGARRIRFAFNIPLIDTSELIYLKTLRLSSGLAITQT